MNMNIYIRIRQVDRSNLYQKKITVNLIRPLPLPSPTVSNENYSRNNKFVVITIFCFLKHIKQPTVIELKVLLFHFLKKVEEGRKER